MRPIKTCAWYEDGEPCINMCEGNTDFCATHNSYQRKQARNASKVKVVKPIKKVSTKRAAENQVYARLRKDYLEAYPVCEVVECHRKSSQIHHMCGRENDKLTDTNNFLAVCDPCHQRITVDTKWALEQGYSILRTI